MDRLTLRNLEIGNQTGPAVELFDVRDALLAELTLDRPGSADAIRLQNVTPRKSFTT